jgi:hypothetical protein
MRPCMLLLLTQICEAPSLCEVQASEESHSYAQASKKLDLWSTPEVLILHLKRFQYTQQSRRKIDAPVSFPLTGLDLSPYLIHQQVGPPRIY